MKKGKKLTIKELKEITPLVDVMELSQWKKYIVVVRKPSIIGVTNLNAEITAREVARCLNAHGIKATMIVNIDLADVKFLEVS